MRQRGTPAEFVWCFLVGWFNICFLSACLLVSYLITPGSPAARQPASQKCRSLLQTSRVCKKAAFEVNIPLKMNVLGTLKEQAQSGQGDFKGGKNAVVGTVLNAAERLGHRGLVGRAASPSH